MKNKIIKGLLPLIQLFCFFSIAIAQQTPPAVYAANQPVNFIRTWDAMAPITDPNALLTKPLSDVKQSTQYFDGLGRPLQTVIKQGSMESGQLPTDLVSPFVYDALGREQYKYLPFASTANDGTQNNGQFKLNPFQQQVAFYNNLLNGQANETNAGANNLNWAYGKINYEASPLNRVMESFAPGVNWVGSESGATPHSIKTQYFVNTLADEVRIWNVTDAGAGSFGSYARSGTYPNGA